MPCAGAVACAELRPSGPEGNSRQLRIRGEDFHQCSSSLHRSRTCLPNSLNVSYIKCERLIVPKLLGAGLTVRQTQRK